MGRRGAFLKIVRAISNLKAALSPVTRMGGHSVAMEMLRKLGQFQAQLLTALTLAGSFAGLDMVLLAHNLEQNVGAAQQYVTDAVSNAGTPRRLRGADATHGCGMELPFYQLKPRATSSRKQSHHLLASGTKGLWAE